MTPGDDPSKNEVRSKPYKIFEANCKLLADVARQPMTAITDFSAQIRAHIQQTSATLQEQTSRLAQARATGSAQDSADSVTGEVWGITEELSTLNTMTDRIWKLGELMAFQSEWLIVMLVTFAEAYIEDTLLCLLREGIASPSALPSAIRSRIVEKWVKDVLRSGGPPKWIKTFEEFGAPDYRSHLKKELQRVWTRRHEIVHSAKSNSPRNLVMQEFMSAFKSVDEFVLATDRFVVGVCPTGLE